MSPFPPPPYLFLADDHSYRRPLHQMSEQTKMHYLIFGPSPMGFFRSIHPDDLELKPEAEEEPSAWRDRLQYTTRLAHNKHYTIWKSADNSRYIRHYKSDAYKKLNSDKPRYLVFLQSHMTYEPQTTIFVYDYPALLTLLLLLPNLLVSESDQKLQQIKEVVDGLPQILSRHGTSLSTLHALLTESKVRKISRPKKQ
jgi:hypothetical protein